MSDTDPGGAVRIEQAGPAHARPLAVLHRLCFCTQRWHRPWRPHEMADVLRLPATRAWIVLARPERAERAERADRADRADPVPAGLILTRGLVPDAEILTLCVRPGPWRRRGLGGRLLDAAITAESAAGCTTMLLEVAADNAPAVAFYEARGFSRCGRRPGYYQTPGPAGGRMDAIVLSRPLTRPPHPFE